MKKIMVMISATVLLAVMVVPGYADDPEPGVWSGQSTEGALPPAGSDVGVAGVGVSSGADVTPSWAVYYWSYLHRPATNKVMSCGWLSANVYLTMGRVRNYVCKGSTCTAWYKYTAYNVYWLYAGWIKTWGKWKNYYTKSEHTYKYAGVKKIKYTSLGVVF